MSNTPIIVIYDYSTDQHDRVVSLESNKNILFVIHKWSEFA
jgi:hypothetical protein